jgi:hydroxyacylglutathione hydrolase
MESTELLKIRILAPIIVVILALLPGSAFADDEVPTLADEISGADCVVVARLVSFDMRSRAMKEKTGAKICLHKEDQWLYDNLQKQCGMFGFTSTDPLPIDHYLGDEEDIKVGNLNTSVIHTPGHTPGSLCFSVQDKESVLIAGDTLFTRSIGRTDLWGGSFEEIVSSISNRLFTLDDSTRVIPGHGPDTSIWEEKRENPFVKKR